MSFLFQLIIISLSSDESFMSHSPPVHDFTQTRLTSKLECFSMADSYNVWIDSGTKDHKQTHLFSR